jgi:hypothetical protein
VETNFEPRETARFLRTLRVATGVAIAREDIRRSHGRGERSATFLALAAKGVEGWRFPEEGLLSGDGLLLARRVRDGDGSGALILQAQGAVGVSTYAGRTALLRVGESWSAEATFDRFGALRAPLLADEFDDAGLAQFEVELLSP